jgi:hypothetical protein
MGFKSILLIISFSIILYISGCVVVPSNGYSFAEVEVETAPPPPPAVVITRPPRPSTAYIWIDGHYVLSSGRWVWIVGRWELPPRRTQIWIEPNIRPRGPRWGYTPGHWR